MANYSYPRVQIHTKAKLHSSVGPVPADTTVLFMPLYTKKGPHNKVVPIHSISEFANVFGVLDADSYAEMGQTALNAYNWLNNGGTLYVTRLNDYSAELYAKYYETNGTTISDSDLGLEAKYIGAYYAGLDIIVSGIGTATASPKVLVIVKEGRNELERFTLSEKNFETVLGTSEYLRATASTTSYAVFVSNLATCGVFTVSGVAPDTKYTASTTTKFSNKNFVPAGEDAPTKVTFTSALDAFWETADTPVAGTAQALISNRLETPIDIIMDAGYPNAVKQKMVAFIDNRADEMTGDVSSVRPDIVGIFDTSDNGTHFEYTNVDQNIFGADEDTSHTKGGRNIAVYTQLFDITDEILTDRDIEVTATYFLSKLLPYNDLAHGVQFPTAGIRRGILDDAKGVNENPSPDKKEALFRARVNYVEKTSREYAFMSQRTYDHSSEEEYTALSFLNNVRALEKMKKELERLGRNYLFEFNDSVTLTQMSNILNKYMTDWVTNRTLNLAVVAVNKNPYSEEAVDITLNIRFNGTIEVISVDITIE